MRTRKELAQRLNSFEKETKKWDFPFTIIFILGLLGMAMMIPRFDDGSTLFNTIATIALFAWLIIPLPILAKVNKKRLKSASLNCPSCSVSLVGPIGRMAITTLYCSKCGSKIVSDENESDDVSSMISK